MTKRHIGMWKVCSKLSVTKFCSPHDDFPNKRESHDVNEILLKVALKASDHQPKPYLNIWTLSIFLNKIYA